MSAYEEAAAALFAAVEPVAAYCERTARPNRHADQLDALIGAVADFGAATDEMVAAKAGEPDWQAIAYRLAERVPLPNYQPSALIARCQALLDDPHMKARAALPLAQRMYLAQINSHYLGPPDYLSAHDHQPV